MNREPIVETFSHTKEDFANHKHRIMMDSRYIVDSEQGIASGYAVLYNGKEYLILGDIINDECGNILVEYTPEYFDISDENSEANNVYSVQHPSNMPYFIDILKEILDEASLYDGDPDAMCIERCLVDEHDNDVVRVCLFYGYVAIVYGDEHPDTCVSIDQKQLPMFIAILEGMHKEAVDRGMVA